MIHITSAGIALLAEILNAEAVAAKPSVHDGFHQFQTNQNIQIKIAEIEKHLTFRNSIYPLIFIGDVSHDRLSCNKDVDRRIREKMHSHGAIFIYGNHDSYSYVETSGPVPAGRLAIDNASKEQWLEHERRVFSYYHYDEARKILYIHNGLKLGFIEGKKVLMHAFGSTEFDLTKRSEEQLKGLIDSLDGVKPGSPLNNAQADAFTDFNSKLQDEDRVCMEEIADHLGIRIVHGHSGTKEESANVVSLNSRRNSSEGRGDLYRTSAAML